MIPFLRKILSILKATGIALFTIFFSLLSLIVILFKKKKPYFSLAVVWSKLLLFISGIKVAVIGKEKINPDTSYIFISNHSSHFDIPVLLSGLSDMVALVYKQELKKIPVFGYALGLSPHISIDRSHPKKAIESINHAVQKLDTGVSVLIFPEGTRSKDGNVGDFKRGAFMLASRSGKPIIPVSVNGTFDILPQEGFNINSAKVRVIIHDPIEDYNMQSPSDERELMQKVKEIIESGKEN